MQKKLQFWSTCLGNLFEHYDTALFGFLSPFLAPLIFPQSEPIVALILTYAMIPLGMVARPLGALVFGYIGDVHGRKQALFLALSGMAIVSGCIALTPLYCQIGALAPLIFCLGRLLQNFLSAGESMGGAIFLLEESDGKRHDLLSSLFNASTIGGILLASAGVAILSQCAAVDRGWRWLYVFGCATAVFGCLIRRSLSDPAPAKIGVSNLLRMFWTHRKALVSIAVASGFAYANYMIALVLMNGFIPLITSYTKAQMATLNTALLVFDFCALPFFGWLSSKISRKSVMVGSALCALVCAIPFFTLLEGAPLFAVVGVRMFFVTIGVAFFAPFHAWAQQLVPPDCRYGVISFGYALGSQLLGGPTAAVSLWLFKTTHIVSSISWYWLLLALGTLFVLVKGRACDAVTE